MKKKRLTLSDKFKLLTDQCTNLSIVNSQRYNQIIALEKTIEELRKDKQWLKTLVQELSSSINAGAREGSFPRR